MLVSGLLRPPSSPGGLGGPLAGPSAAVSGPLYTLTRGGAVGRWDGGAVGRWGGGRVVRDPRAAVLGPPAPAATVEVLGVPVPMGQSSPSSWVPLRQRCPGRERRPRDGTAVPAPRAPRTALGRSPAPARLREPPKAPLSVTRRSQDAQPRSRLSTLNLHLHPRRTTDGPGTDPRLNDATAPSTPAGPAPR